jgi:hypothetical protein
LNITERSVASQSATASRIKDVTVRTRAPIKSIRNVERWLWHHHDLGENTRYIRNHQVVHSHCENIAFNGEADKHDVELEGTYSRADIVFSTVSRRVSWSMTMLLRPTEATLSMSSFEHRQTMVVKSKVPSPWSKVLRISRRKSTRGVSKTSTRRN